MLVCNALDNSAIGAVPTDSEIREIKSPLQIRHFDTYRWTWIWRTTVWRIFAYDGRYAWSQSDAYQVFVICIRQILHMTDQFSWSHWVRHIQVHLYIWSTWNTFWIWLWKEVDTKLYVSFWVQAYRAKNASVKMWWNLSADFHWEVLWV